MNLTLGKNHSHMQLPFAYIFPLNNLSSPILKNNISIQTVKLEIWKSL